jgi:hypothetical protein
MRMFSAKLNALHFHNWSEVRGNPWKSMEVSGSSWKSLEVHKIFGSPCKFMEVPIFWKSGVQKLPLRFAPRKYVVICVSRPKSASSSSECGFSTQGAAET